MVTREEMYEQMDIASERQESGEGFGGMSYEDGVKAALEWASGDSDVKPMED